MLHNSEKNYCVTQTIMLAVFCVEHVKHYVLGRTFLLVLRTDHRSLVLHRSSGNRINKLRGSFRDMDRAFLRLNEG